MARLLRLNVYTSFEYNTFSDGNMMNISVCLILIGASIRNGSSLRDDEIEIDLKVYSKRTRSQSDSAVVCVHISTQLAGYGKYSRVFPHSECGWSLQYHFEWRLREAVDFFTCIDLITNWIVGCMMRVGIITMRGERKKFSYQYKPLSVISWLGKFPST